MMFLVCCLVFLWSNFCAEKFRKTQQYCAWYKSPDLFLDNLVWSSVQLESSATSCTDEWYFVNKLDDGGSRSLLFGLRHCIDAKTDRTGMKIIRKTPQWMVCCLKPIIVIYHHPIYCIHICFILRYLYCPYIFSYICQLRVPIQTNPQFGMKHIMLTIFTNAQNVRQDNGQLIEEATRKKGVASASGQFLSTALGGSSHMVSSQDHPH